MDPKLKIISSLRGHLPVWQVLRLKAGALQNGADRPFRIQFRLRSSKNNRDSGRAATRRRFVPLRAKSLQERTNVFISFLKRHHLYTNKSQTLRNLHFVGLSRQKCLP
jgi:hypothetical protein